MKEYILLYRSKLNKYYNIEKNPKSKLLDLNIFFLEDYRSYDQDIFNKNQIFYNTTYIYNDFKNNMIYVGFAEWSIDEEIESPDDDDFPDYVNESNSCKISHENFKEFVEHWLFLKKELPPFALIYRDESDWIHCQGFQSEKEMEQFVKDYKSETIH